jgi:DNA-binding beta-propeller fold protein YncE
MRLFRALAFAIVALALALPAQASFVTFETGQVRPLALSPDGTRLFALNTPDSRLEVFDVDGNGDLSHASSVPVGMEPIAVAALSNDEVWVVNHLSDSISIVDVNGSPARVVRTLLVGDEPRDIVVANTVNGPRVFVTTAHRGQNTPLHDTIETDLRTAGQGRADVWVFDPTDLGATLEGAPQTILTFFGDTPRALAVSPDGGTVYAAVFHSGNQTTSLSEGAVCNGGTGAGPCPLDGVTVPNGMPGGMVPGGLPGPDTNFQGFARPEVGLIVKFNNTNGRWEDQEFPPRNWTNAVRFNLPDFDVFTIDANDDPPSAAPATFAHVGTILFNMIVNPANSKVYVTNTDARNEVRFEGPGTFGGSTVRGHLAEARITVLDGINVLPRHLNKHITAQPQGYGTVPMTVGVKDDSLATPLGMAITADGSTLYVAAFGSSKVGIFDTAEIEGNTFVPDDADHVDVTGGGPTGLVLNESKNRLYVLTRFDNSVSVINTSGAPSEIAHLSLYNPEPPEVVDGRPFLYDARFTSSNGEASCSSCHIFADFDSLAWDLGNPDDIRRSNPNPGGVVFGGQQFHPMKGPMTTQTLRGMATHGPMHWRGDRTGAYVEPNTQPNSGAFNESLAFQEFNPAFEGLVGRDEGLLSAADMEAFTDFILEVKLPPNPIRELDNSLSTAAQNGENFFFGPPSDGVANCNGCHFLNPPFGFFGTDGTSTFENETQEFKVAHLRNMYQKIGMFGMPDVSFFNGGDNGHKGNQIRGFGFLHDGSTDTLFRFHQATVFNFSGGDPQRRDVEAFMFAFDSDLKPVVGQQTTLTDTNGGVMEVDARIDLFIARAEALDCDLIVKGTVGSEDRGWLYDTGDNLFHSDRISEAGLTDNDLRALAATPGQELTYTCVPPGSGERGGIDRDEDMHRDRDEVDAGSDPADPFSTPGGPTPTPTPITPTPTSPPITGQCGSSPPAGCKTPGKGTVLVRAIAGKEGLQWKWLQGEQTDLSELGDPVQGTVDYSLCMYSGPGANLVMDVGPIVQAACGDGPCWKATGSGYRYKDSAAQNDGIHLMSLKAGATGSAKMIVKGRGGNLPLPNLTPNGLPLPVQVVLQNDEGECWATTFTTATKNDSTIFKAN